VVYNFVSFSFHAAKGLVRISLHEECFKLLYVVMTFNYILYFQVMLGMFVRQSVTEAGQSCASVKGPRF
jgi:hypothetical protein